MAVKEPEGQFRGDSGGDVAGTGAGDTLLQQQGMLRRVMYCRSKK